MEDQNNSRRDFLKKTTMAGAGIAIGGLGFSAKSYGNIIGANDRITMAVLGIRGQGKTHIDKWCALKTSRNVRLKTLCDTDEQYFEAGSKTVFEKTGEKPVTEWDMRKVFDDKEIDAVSMATPNHWHALGTIWACQAGKHVYVEKPASHDFWEGKKMIEAARKYNRRVQVGFQNRSIANVMEAIKFLHDGGIGDVFMARGLCIKPRDSFGIAPDSTAPASLHFDRWVGPAAMFPYNEKKVHYNWHWFWNTGNGDTGNQGPHQFDIARWGLNKNVHPVSIYSNGNVFGIDPKECAQETPNTQTSIFKYDDGKILEFETRGRYSNGESSFDIRIGNMFFGTDGYLELDGDKWKAFRKRETTPFAGSKTGPSNNVDNPLTPPGGSEHYANFVEAIRTGKDADLHCDIKEGFYSSALPLLANISYKLNRSLTFSGGQNGNDTFVNDKEADALLTRKYRKEYTVPDKV